MLSLHHISDIKLIMQYLIYGGTAPKSRICILQCTAVMDAMQLLIGRWAWNFFVINSRVVDAFLPFSWSLKLQKYQNIIFFVFIVALWFGWLDGIMDWVGNGVLMLAVNFVSLFL